MPGEELKPFCPPCRPIAHSAQQIGRPIKRKEMMYAIMKAPPPYSATSPGKRRKFPNPTALPDTAKITPTREFHFSSCIFDIVKN